MLLWHEEPNPKGQVVPFRIVKLFRDYLVFTTDPVCLLEVISMN